MTLRIMGAVMMIAASVGMGALFSSSCRKRIRSLTEALELIVYVRRSIEAFRTPVGEILATYRSEYLEECGFADSMRQNGLTAAIRDGYLDLPEQAETELLAFAEKLGTDYADSEVKRCDYYVSVLERMAAEESERLSLNGRLYLFLPPLGVLSLIILLI